MVVHRAPIISAAAKNNVPAAEVWRETKRSPWDYDSVTITQLYDTTIGGEMRKVLSQTNRNGFFYTSIAPTASSSRASPSPP
jgi:glucose dehydrogenase